jgi:DNA repair exonuclease SbcCD ATPase subunit
MKSTMLFILSLFVVSTYSQFLRNNKFSDAHTILTEVDKHHFGSAILSTISIHMSSETPIEEVDQLLNEVKTELESDQADDDARNRTNQENCDKHISEYKNNIEFHSSSLKSNEELLELTKGLLKTSQENLESVNADLDRNAARYAEGEKTRNEQHAEYEVKVQEHDEAILAVEEASKLVSHLQTGALFVQLKSKFNKITERLTKHKSRHILYQPIIKSLAELASKADQESVKRILALLDNLKTALAESKQIEVDTENQQAKDWESLSNDLTNERKNLSERKQNLENDIEGQKKKLSMKLKPILFIIKNN